MLILVIVLLAIWAILAVIGFAIQGLLWLAIIAVILFLALRFYPRDVATAAAARPPERRVQAR